MKFAHVHHNRFTSSRVVGTTSKLVASGVRVKHPFSKREDVAPKVKVTHEDVILPDQPQSMGKSCAQRKEKHCTNIPELKTIPSEICLNKITTVYIDECESSGGTEKFKPSSEAAESSPIVGRKKIVSSGYWK